MPLHKGYSAATFEKNIRKLVKEGARSTRQIIAIAYSEARRALKAARKRESQKLRDGWKVAIGKGLKGSSKSRRKGGVTSDMARKERQILDAKGRREDATRDRHGRLPPRGVRFLVYVGTKNSDHVLVQPIRSTAKTASEARERAKKWLKSQKSSHVVKHVRSVDNPMPKQKPRKVPKRSRRVEGERKNPLQLRRTSRARVRVDQTWYIFMHPRGKGRTGDWKRVALTAKSAADARRKWRGIGFPGMTAAIISHYPDALGNAEATARANAAFTAS